MESTLHTTFNSHCPVDVWELVLREATFDNHLNNIPGDAEDTSPGAVERFQELKATKRNVVLVCKTWNALGMRFLLEHVSLTRLSQLDRLYTVLGRDKSDGGCLGAFTVRLDIILTDIIPSVRYPLLQSYCRKVETLLRWLPNVDILYFKQSSRPDSNSPALSVLAPREWHDILVERVQGIRALGSPSICENIDGALALSAEATFPSDLRFHQLRSLHLSSFTHSCLYAKLPSECFPVLDQVIYDTRRLRWSVDDGGFLLAHGQKISTLHLIFHTEHWSLRRGYGVVLQELCPNLQELQFRTAFWENIRRFRHTKVEVVVIYVPSDVKKDEVKAFLGELHGSFPSLKTLRLTREPGVQQPNSHALDILNLLITRSTSRGITVEDGNGRIIGHPASAWPV
ncbi:hypothetical protein FA15DRAFT_668097 [Coprinopsis marcescibilis]|uniref:F-box domain-containing protein n=1 Tax=Coprinopsis marcescibilis TaxID=230819 RepID=A0A5C3KZL8_COPMA|nr:hypothetical protein FA15DRAFT_668097 [Coprinopsis marcescibilis]